MDRATFQELLTEAGQAALRAAEALEPAEADFLRDFNTLQNRFPTELARAALEIAILRLEGRAKFPEADRMYFTRPALEQATHQLVAEYRSARYTEFDRIADLGCSIGSDTIALAGQAPVIGLDLDPLRLAMAAENLRAVSRGLPSSQGYPAGGGQPTGSDQPAPGNGYSQGPIHPATFIQANLKSPLPLALSPRTALFFDPGRRAGGRRIYSVRQYHPPLDVIRGWLKHSPALGVKLSPGVDLDELADYDAEIEFISLDGELKEAVLWFGPLCSGARRRATRLPGPYTLESSGDVPEPPAKLVEPLRYIFEPDPAVLRAGVVRLLAEQLGAGQLDPQIAYLSGERAVETPFARRWEVEAWMPFQLKRLREALRQREVGRVTVKKRGSPLEPETLIQKLRLKDGSEERVLFLTQLRGRPIVVIAFP